MPNLGDDQFLIDYSKAKHDKSAEQNRGYNPAGGYTRREKRHHFVLPLHPSDGEHCRKQNNVFA